MDPTARNGRHRNLPAKQKIISTSREALRHFSAYPPSSTLDLRSGKWTLPQEMDVIASKSKGHIKKPRSTLAFFSIPSVVNIGPQVREVDPTARNGRYRKQNEMSYQQAEKHFGIFQHTPSR